MMRRERGPDRGRPTWRRGACLAAGLLAAAGCAVVRRDAGFPEVSRAVADSVGATRIHWYQGTTEDEAAAAALAALLARPLDVGAAVQVALLANPDVQALYERLGVAQADLVQAGLLRNPVFVGAFRPSTGSPSGTNVEMDLVQDFLSLVFLPARKRLAAGEFAREQQRVAGAVLALAADVRRSYFELQGAMNLAAVFRTSADLARTSAELASRFHDAGNVSALALATERGLAEQLDVERARAEAAVVPARERLHRLLGLPPEQRGWRIPETLPPLPETEPAAADLAPLAMTKRPDIRAARQEVETLRQALALVRTSRWIPGLEAGVSTERDPDGTAVVGPSVALGLPLFDQGQAAVARLESELRRSERRLEATARAADSEIREADARVRAARELAARYQSVLIPLRRRIVDLSLEEFNYMLIGPFNVLAAKQAEIDAYRGYVDAVRDYWVARADLAHALAAPLPDSVAPPAGAGADAAALPSPGLPAEHQHHHGGH